uniref:Uncharacterized protein n=1 Tax=Ciona savignyi TaxID=51511 RepID=H2YHZ3_CIOSA
MVTKAALALSDKLGKRCETAVAEVDFKYSTNVDLLTQVSFPEADWTKIELANNEPLCILEQMPRYYDLTEVQSIHNPESLNVKRETCFEELLLNQSGSKSMIEVSRRLVHLLRTQPTWIPSYYAGYYWRTTGDAKQTITCFMHSLSVAAPEHHPVVVAALSDFLATSGHLSDSLVMGRHLPELAPSPSNYYLIGDMFGANNQFITAADHYISATMDGDYKEARLKMKAAVCRHIAD